MGEDPRGDALAEAPVGSLLHTIREVARLIGREGTSPASIIDRVAYLVEQHDSAEAARDAFPAPEHTTPAGYVVAGYQHGRLVADWDGEVHETRGRGEEEVLACRRAGYSDWQLYALRPVDAALPAPAAPDRDEGECRCASCAENDSAPDRSEGNLDAWDVGELAVVLDRRGAYPDIQIEDEGHHVMTLDRSFARDLGTALLRAADRITPTTGEAGDV